MRRGLTWALTVPLLLGGIEAAHALAYRLVYPQLHARVLLATGHAYLAWLPLLLGLSGALVNDGAGEVMQIRRQAIHPAIAVL